MKIINVTPHPVTFQSWNGRVYEVEPCGVLINARPVETTVRYLPTCGHGGGTDDCPLEHGQCSSCIEAAELVRTRFEADPASEEALTKLERENPGAVIVGSIVAAQAFPGRVLAMIPVPGFERVPPAEKRMRDDKFTTF